MSGSVVLLHLAGAVALLLYATRMIRTGVERAFGHTLRRRLRALGGHRAPAVAAGTALAMAMQSSTAVSLLVGSFVGTGMLAASLGLAAVLGADLGSALVVKVFSYDLQLLAPVALLVGTTCFLATERRVWRQTGRLCIGLGLLVLSLGLIGQPAEPLRSSELLPVIVSFLQGDLIVAFLVAALVTWLFHSSVAFILLVAALAARDLVPLELGVALVLGANLGGGVIAALLARTLPEDGRLVPVANLVLRGSGAMAVLALTGLVGLPFAALGASVPEQLVHTHILFNAALVLVGTPLAGWLTERLRRLQSRVPPVDGPVSALDPADLDEPPRALANATREMVGIFETVEAMLRAIESLYEHPDRERMAALAEMDDSLDERYAAIKVYLSRIRFGRMRDEDAERCNELIGACVKLEQVGDIIVGNMLAHVRTKLDRGVRFSDAGREELRALLAMVRSSAQLAFNLLISRDSETAVELVRAKQRLRELAEETSARHFERLRSGVAQSLDSSALHLDTVRDLKQIHSLLASIAYPMLEREGRLRASRLEPDAPA